jgi:hypothetical protein
MPEQAADPTRAVAEKRTGAALSPDLIHVARSLHDKYDRRLGGDLVESEIVLFATKFAGAPLRGFVPLLVRRYAEEALRTDCQGLVPGARDASGALMNTGDGQAGIG